MALRKELTYTAIDFFRWELRVYKSSFWFQLPRLELVKHA